LIQLLTIIVEVVLNSLSKAVIILIMVLLLGFTIVKNEELIPAEPVVVEEVVDYNKANTSIIDYIDKGEMKASWYGPRFHGKITANGEIYDQMAFTAAHKQLKFGTLLRVTNPRNNKSVIVRINDRGPYIKGRHLDLSKGAALELDMVQKGVMKVKIEEIALKGINFPVINLN
jgi:rare lipoprotein A